MRKLLLLTVIVLFPALAFSQLKMGIMDPQVVLDAIPEAAEIESQLQTYVEERERVFQQRYMDWIEDVTDYSERVEAGTLSDSERREIEERLAEGESELQALQNRIQNQIRQRQNELFSPLLNRVDTAMETISRELGLDYVVNKTSNTGDPIIYYASERGIDITERVIEYLQQN